MYIVFQNSYSAINFFNLFENLFTNTTSWGKFKYSTNLSG